MDTSFRSYIAEFVGTFMLVFIGTAVASLTGFGDLGHADAKYLEISFAFGFTLMVLVYVIGPVSGCHVNPAVTLPMALAGRMKWGHVPGYLIGQFLGALVASLVLYQILQGVPGFDPKTNNLGSNVMTEGMQTSSMLILETLMTALFLFTILSVTKRDTALVGMAIGGFLFVSHLVGAQLGDSSLNPARSFGPAIFFGGAPREQLWIFMVGPFVGGVIGWLVYKVVQND